MTPDFEATRRLFDLPEGVIYLDGNSRGPLPRSIEARMLGVIAKERGRMLICDWNQAGWMDKPCCDGDCIAGRQVGPPQSCNWRGSMQRWMSGTRSFVPT